ncbi:crossover junction endodeoxyribonuclease RuvC [Patescibacteria group bacterium]|nr:crossover junction endodeoxyribonuclease RuvC [Patescibacteria group bacterium]
MIILGIDPGTATTGFGVIKKIKNKKAEVIDYGCILTTPDLCPGDRLKIISNELNKLIKKHQPKILAVENLYFFKNLKTAIPVSQAKGVILLTAAKKKIPVYEFTPLQVKMTITGYGKAEKKQVQKMIQTMLNLEEKPKDKNKRKDDATDALGIALCYTIKSKIKLS